MQGIYGLLVLWLTVRTFASTTPGVPDPITDFPVTFIGAEGDGSGTTDAQLQPSVELAKTGAATSGTSAIVYHTPKILAEETIILNVSENKDILCIGSRPLKWTWATSDEYTSQVITRQANDTGADGLFRQVLHIINARWFDARFYYCSYADDPPPSMHLYSAPSMQDSFQPPPSKHDDKCGSGAYGIYGRNPEPTVAKYAQIFIFVTDPTKAFQYVAINFFVLPINRPLILPCGVTDPSIKVDLFVNYVNQTNAEGIRYDPKIGFFVISPTYEYQNGVFCYANTTAINESKDIRIFVHMDGGNLTPTPLLDINKPNFQVGETLQLHCWVKVVKDFTVYMDFDYPQKDHSVPRHNDTLEKAGSIQHIQDNGRYIIKPPLRVTHGDFDHITNTLTVHDLRVEDSGYFCCTTTVTGAPNNYERSSIYIQVYDKPFIELTTEFPYLTALDTDGATKLTVDIISVPTPTVQWYFEGKRLKNEDVISR
ncbi:vascular endothelial growth factor receptor 3-like [Physella acuta]|uniref:vascular endothelial growth factor receptor 3-like n=1 Tax=Physella acuta TaxID=109671 RepID=UPI0027DD3312|nr:vascular endothelial growth factor receptor 3-like [Physella acuta]